MQKFGIDVSRWQGNFNFTTAKNEGIEFAIIKAGGSDCNLYKDSQFESNYKKCKDAGIPVGAYFFGHEMTLDSVNKGADYFISLLKDKQFEYPVYYDVEAEMLNLDKTLLNQIISAFCKRVQDAGYYVGVYASLSPFKSKITDTAFTHWVACYGKSKPTSGGNCDIWQFGGETNLIRTNKVAGVVCDQDYCYRDFPSEIKSKGLNGYGKTPTPTPTPKSNYLMTAEKYVNTLKHIVNECPTVYNNHYPKNLGYWDGARFSFDCWNLIKAVLNGWYDNRTVGYYQKDLSKTGDIDGYHILMECSTRGKDFKQLSIPGTYLFMENDHAGTYVGEHTINGKIVNVIECTSAWTKNVQWSYVDANGYRYQYKNGAKSSRKWDDWGLMDWVDYSNAPVPEPTPKPKTDKPEIALPTLRTGNRGEQVLNLQEDLNYLGYTDEYGKELDLDGEFGKCTDFAVRAFQATHRDANNKDLGVDGIYGKNSYYAMQKALK